MLKFTRHRRCGGRNFAESWPPAMTAAAPSKAGENMDSAIEEATQGQENLGDGALEQAGEGIDEATGNQQNNDAADAINDATDGDQQHQSVTRHALRAMLDLSAQTGKRRRGDLVAGAATFLTEP